MCALAAPPPSPSPRSSSTSCLTPKERRLTSGAQLGAGAKFLSLPLGDRDFDIGGGARLQQLRELGVVVGGAFGSVEDGGTYINGNFGDDADYDFDPNMTPVLHGGARKHVILPNGMLLPVYGGDDGKDQFVSHPNLVVALKLDIDEWDTDAGDVVVSTAVETWGAGPQYPLTNVHTMLYDSRYRANEEADFHTEVWLV